MFAQATRTLTGQRLRLLLVAALLAVVAAAVLLDARSGSSGAAGTGPGFYYHGLGHLARFYYHG